ncbi:MAG: dienelactone hydrolase family protein [Methyloversatilis sp.]|nr:dienelactone hydrolase family protein [Methyloversatilis sp.]
MAQQIITTPASGLDTGMAEVGTADAQNLPVYFARPAATPKPPVVLVVQEIFGVHEHIRDVCRRFARAGYFAIAPELYFRQGDPSKISSVPEILERIVSRVGDAQVMSDLDSCVAWAAQSGGDAARLAATGFCWGGRITWLYAAHQPALRAGVAWYGKLDGLPGELTPNHPIDLADALKAPVLGLYGGKDQGIPTSDVDAMRDALTKSPADAARRSDIVLYPEAPHGFHADFRPSYREVDARDGWQRCLAWMAANGA